jgi:hypothetical protein
MYNADSDYCIHLYSTTFTSGDIEIRIMHETYKYKSADEKIGHSNYRSAEGQASQA